LQIFEVRTIIEFDEAKGFGIANGSDSSVDGKGFSEKVRGGFEYLRNRRGRH
jgi:hypothetical protein